MAVFRLTPDNLAFAKSELRRSLPNIRSSHLSEALAAGLGKLTHAALRARMADAAIGAEDVVTVDDTRWRERLVQLGYGEQATDALTQTLLRPDLPDPCWREFSSRDRGAIDDWFYYCESQKIPYVFVVTARKYSKLEWDCISVPPSHEGRIRHKEAKPVLDWLFKTFQANAKMAPGNPIFEGSPFVGGIERLLPETARTLADKYFAQLYELTRTPVRDHE
ncbi:hypothetical protein [Caulobacter soli]|uniref:hypothetical protein n=1 Tax=Caulobacter soli TaxID=2708539 RepID=UPI0013EC001B|nr:hypothetical protein [Caulobacter soli]